MNSLPNLNKTLTLEIIATTLHFHRRKMRLCMILHYLFQVFEAEKMITKRGMYHKKCFSCVACKSQLQYYGAIEGPDDEVILIVLYFSNRGPNLNSPFLELSKS